MTFPSEIEFIVSQNDKGGNPKRPDYRGEVKIAGQTYELAAWKRTKQGTTRQFVSGKLKLKVSEAPRQAEQAPSEGFEPKKAPDVDEDQPF